MMNVNIEKKKEVSDKMFTKNIEKTKHYLTSSFPAKCSNVSEFKTHSTTFALSDKANEMGYSIFYPYRGMDAIIQGVPWL